MQHFTPHRHSRLATHSFPPISHILTHPSAPLSQLWTSSVANKEQWEFSLANKGSCLISCQWRSLPSLTWPKQKMHPSAPFTTDWMTSATVPEHTSACGKTQREKPLTVTVNLQFSHIQEILSHRHTENDEFKTLSYKLNNYLALVTPNHINGFSIFHHSWLCLFMCVCVCCNAWLILAICFSMGPLGQGFCSRGPLSYITQQTRPPTAEQLVVTVSHQQCCPSGTIQQLGLSSSAATFRL